MRINEIIKHLIEADKDRRGFLKSLGKGALGVGAAAAVGMKPTDVLAKDDDRLSKFSIKNLSMCQTCL